MSDTPGRRPRTPLEEALEHLPNLINRIDRLAGIAEREAIQSSEVISLLRGKINDLLFTGTANLVAPSSNPTNLVSWQRDFAVPFASVAIANTTTVGLIVSTDPSAPIAGPGTAIVAPGDAVCVPLIGRVLTIAAQTAPGTPSSCFVVVYADRQPFSWAKG